MNRRELLKASAVLPLLQAARRFPPARKRVAGPHDHHDRAVSRRREADLAARPVALALEKALGKSVIVDNRAGGAAERSATRLLRAPSRMATHC